MKQLILGYFSTDQAVEILKISKPGLTKVTRAEGWTPLNVGTSKFYCAEDILEYRDHKLRTLLVKALGWRGRGHYRVTDIDTSCPECRGFAVEWPPPPQLAERVLCLNGHKSRL